MKRAKKRNLPKLRNPVARALPARKGGPHGKSTRALRKAANDALRAAKLNEE